MPRFPVVLFDWRGTLALPPTFSQMVHAALTRLGRNPAPDAVEYVVDRLRRTDRREVDSPAVDTDPALHRTAHAAWFAEAGLDDQLARTLYEVGDLAELNPFAEDVGETMEALHAAGVSIGILSDIHFDLRASFARHRTKDGRAWTDLIEVWVLSYEVGLVKPDPAIFAVALERFGVPAEDVLMVGDRGPWDGGAAAVGITTLLLPSLRSTKQRRLATVLDLVLPQTCSPRASQLPDS
jgi:FMN phosphatase YigB (HAD superfamily)